MYTETENKCNSVLPFPYFSLSGTYDSLLQSDDMKSPTPFPVIQYTATGNFNGLKKRLGQSIT